MVYNPTKTINNGVYISAWSVRSRRVSGHWGGVHVAVRWLGRHGLPPFRWDWGLSGRLIGSWIFQKWEVNKMNEECIKLNKIKMIRMWFCGVFFGFWRKLISWSCQDSFIADLVVGLRTGQIKTGAPVVPRGALRWRFHVASKMGVNWYEGVGRCRKM